MNQLEKLFRPQSVALVGATDRPGAFGYIGAQSLIETGDKLRSYFINPKREELLGKKCFHGLSELPECPELVIVAIPAKGVNPTLIEAGEMGCKAAIVYSSGFSEDHRSGGEELEREMLEIARKYGMKIVGPNCVGIINNVDKIKLWGSSGKIDMSTRPTGVAVLAQSGGYTIGGVDRQFIDLSYAISSGNGNVCTIEELAEFCVEDENVTAVAMYLEGVKKPEVFYRLLAKGVELHKPIIILKSGRSQKGAISAASHTGNLAGSNEVFEAVFEKFGVLTADTAEEFYGLLQACSILRGKLPAGGNFGILCRSGGETTMSADLAERYGVELPDITEETRGALNQVLPAFAIAKNPMDMTADVLGNKEQLIKLFELFGADRNLDAVVAAFDFESIPPVGVGFDMNAFMGDAVLRYRSLPGAKPMFMVPQFESNRDPVWRMKLKEAEVPLLPPGEIGYSILGKLSRQVAYKAEEHLRAWAVPTRTAEHTKAMSEYESKQELARNGIPVPKQAVARSEEELRAACEEFGFPLVLKINSEDILHKTEAGGVKLNLRSTEDAVKAYGDILSTCKAFKPDARLDGILVQAMAPAGTEMILGVKNDAQFGPMLLCGMGGVFVEIFRDAVLTPCPLSKAEALFQLHRLKAFRLLEGYRGSAPRDVDALAELMVSLSEYAVREKDTLKEMDINPVFVYEKGKGVCVVDALIVKE